MLQVKGGVVRINGLDGVIFKLIICVGLKKGRQTLVALDL
jgi:hypothetical protein